MSIRLAVVGKGGAGKSLVAATLARVIARRGLHVLAVDSDTMPGLALSLGIRTPETPALLEATERGPDTRWRFRHGIGPVRAVQRFAYEAPDGVRLLEFGNVGPGGQPELMPAIQGLWRTAQGVGSARALRDWSIVGDLPAGPRQVAYDWAPYARTFLVLAEPTMQSLLTARRIRRIASARPAGRVEVVASKVKDDRDLARIEGFLGARAAAAVPWDGAVVEAERAGVALIDHAPDSPAVRAIEALTDRLVAQEREGVPVSSPSATNSS